MRGIRTLAREIRRRAIPIALTLPLAFSALYQIDAMNLADGLVESSQAIVPASELRIVTPGIRRQFLRDERQAFTVTIAKEEFFRTEVPYGAVIYDEAIRNGFAPELIAAVVETESDFRPRLRSNKEALGLMQIIPETGRLMGARDLFNPHENVRAGVKYLRYLSDRYDGNMKMVLAAYNAGEGNVARFGGVPPFRETVDYLQRVSTRKLLYQRPAARRRETLERDLARADTAVTRLIEAYQEQLISLDELRARTPPLRKRQTTLRAQLDALEAELHDAETYLQLADTLEGFLGRLADGLDQLDIAEQQRILRLVVREVLIGGDDDTITIRHTIPTPTGPDDPSYLLRGSSPLAADGQHRAHHARRAIARGRLRLRSRQADAGGAGGGEGPPGRRTPRASTRPIRASRP